MGIKKTWQSRHSVGGKNILYDFLIFWNKFLKYRRETVKKLVTLDLIEKVSLGEWKVVDPIFSRWIAGL
jgi:hypothetical protein